MYLIPTTITSSTTKILIAVITAAAREDSLVPVASRTVSTAMISTAPQSNSMPPISTMPEILPVTSPRYSDHPFATTDAASANSRVRSQPMIQATNSPNVA